MSIAQHLPTDPELVDEPTSYVEERPWGRFELLVLNRQVSVKVITVAPGQRLSLQTHECRDEWWQMLDPGLCVEIDGVTWSPEVVEKVWIPRGVTHRVSNPHEAPGRFLEIALGVFDEEDIERLEDDYARLPEPAEAGPDAVRRGLRLPRLRSLFGKAGAWALTAPLRPRLGEQLERRAGARPSEELLDVGADGVRRQHQLLGDRPPVGSPEQHQEHLALPRGEVVDEGAGALP